MKTSGSAPLGAMAGTKGLWRPHGPLILLVTDMVTSRIIGLFVGAVLLAVGYQIFMEWVDNGEEGADSEPADSDPAAT